MLIDENARLGTDTNYDLQPVFWNERESVRAELAA